MSVTYPSNLSKGYSSLNSLNISIDNSNVAYGNNSLTSLSNGSNNTCLGNSSLASLTNGSNNLAIGINSGINNITGSNNTFLGAYTGTLTTGLSNSTAIGYNSRATDSNQIMLGTTSEYVYVPGNLGVGTQNNSSFNLDVCGNVLLDGNINIDGSFNINSGFNPSYISTTGTYYKYNPLLQTSTKQPSNLAYYLFPYSATPHTFSYTGGGTLNINYIIVGGSGGGGSTDNTFSPRINIEFGAGGGGAGGVETGSYSLNSSTTTNLKITTGVGGTGGITNLAALEYSLKYEATAGGNSQLINNNDNSVIKTAGGGGPGSYPYINESNNAYVAPGGTSGNGYDDGGNIYCVAWTGTGDYYYGCPGAGAGGDAINSAYNGIGPPVNISFPDGTNVNLGAGGYGYNIATNTRIDAQQLTGNGGGGGFYVADNPVVSGGMGCNGFALIYFDYIQDFSYNTIATIDSDIVVSNNLYLNGNITSNIDFSNSLTIPNGQLFYNSGSLTYRNSGTIPDNISNMCFIDISHSAIFSSIGITLPNATNNNRGQILTFVSQSTQSGNKLYTQGLDKLYGNNLATQGVNNLTFGTSYPCAIVQCGGLNRWIIISYDS